ncbi:MAG: ferrous iron transport protein B [Elusimicrobia bacterium]|nr:ferrous iron transport protein B [Elusimicrobiota bacterium]
MHNSSSLDLPEHKQVALKRVVLVGHPNVGKSVLFNALTGKYVMVSNYPGTTVDVAKGLGEVGGHLFEFVDSPGIYSLVAHSDEERVTRRLLLDRPDIVVQVADSKNLHGVLALTLELTDLQIAMVLCLNMKDEALSRGFHVDSHRLSRILGIPVVETVATTREGLQDLRQSLLRATAPSFRMVYPSKIEAARRDVEPYLSREMCGLFPLLLQNHLASEEILGLKRFLSQEIMEKVEAARRKFERPLSGILMACRREQADLLGAEVWSRPSQGNPTRLARWLGILGTWSLRPWPGYLIAGFVLWGMYEFVGVLGAQTLVDFLEETVFGNFINPMVSQAVQNLLPWRWLQDILVGEYGVFTMALTYAFALILPIVTTFFLALGFLEDTGYLPRLSVLLNRFFRLIGLNGKAVFPMILGLGCGSMAMLTTRILDTKKEKILMSFLLALAVPCSAQLGVLMAMGSGLPLSVFGIWLFVVVGSLLGTGWAASKVLPGAPSPFLLEIPPMRLPQMGNLIRKVASRLKWYLREVVPLFIYGTMALYFLDAFGLLKIIGRWSSPVVTGFLGLPEKATEAFWVGFFRRDYGAAGFYQMQRDGLLSLRQSAVSMVAIALFMPCIAQWLMSVKERGMKATLLISGFVLFYALGIAAAVNQILIFLGWA